MAEYTGGIGLADADIMKHGCFEKKLPVEMKFGMDICYMEGFTGHRLTMNDEDAPQGCILVVILMDDSVVIHFLCLFCGRTLDVGDDIALHHLAATLGVDLHQTATKGCGHFYYLSPGRLDIA